MSKALVPQPNFSGAITPAGIPALIAQIGKRGAMRFVEFFTVNIRNPNTRRAYHRAVLDFFNWLQEKKVTELG